MKKTLLIAVSLMMLAVFAVGCFNNDEATDTATVAPVVTAEATMEVPADDVTAEPTADEGAAGDAADDAAAGESDDNSSVTEEGGEETTPDETEASN